MRLFRGVLAGVGLMGAIYAATAFAAPAETETIRYYDDNGVLVGMSEQGCTGRTVYVGIITDNYTIENHSCGNPPPYVPPPFPEIR